METSLVGGILHVLIEAVQAVDQVRRLRGRSQIQVEASVHAERLVREVEHVLGRWGEGLRIRQPRANARDALRSRQPPSRFPERAPVVTPRA